MRKECREVGLMGGQLQNRPRSHFVEITEWYQCQGMMGGESLSLPECQGQLCVFLNACRSYI